MILMRVAVYIILLTSLLYMAAAGCRSSSGSNQQSAPSQPSAPAQQAAESQTPAATSPNPGEAAGGQQPNSNVKAGATKNRIDACALLTSADIQATQDEPLKETKGNEQTTGAFAISQCFYQLASFNKSVSLEVTQKAPNYSGSESPREFWNEKFRPAAGKDEDRDREKGRGGEEEAEGRPPQPVPGVGDDAYWVGSRPVGALYVL
ncbi:MAG: hypothetical protein JOY92_00535, partial [Verrucomicrobia bacterium]|nr:hypothetical protein [Verrucomicrobiota bacterium]